MSGPAPLVADVASAGSGTTGAEPCDITAGSSVTATLGHAPPNPGLSGVASAIASMSRPCEMRMWRRNEPSAIASWQRSHGIVAAAAAVPGAASAT